MDGDADMVPSSPSAETSPSSSDIATESTGSSSFFRDRSTTLGTLMGVSLADDESEHGQERQAGRDAAEGTETFPRGAGHGDGEGWRWRRRWRRRRWRSGGGGGGWWRLCRDDIRGTTSLGHFLHIERQISGAGLLCGDGGGGGGGGERDAAAAPFENATVPGEAAGEESGKWKVRRPAQGSSSLARLPVLLTAICSGGAA